MLRDGAQRQRREEGQRSEDVNDAYQDHGEDGGVGAQRANRIADKPLAHQGAGNGQLDHDGQIAAEEHGQTGGDVPEVGCYPPAPQSRNRCWQRKRRTHTAPGSGRGSPGW